MVWMLVRSGVPPPQLSCAGSSWSVSVVTVLVGRVGHGSGVWHQVQPEPDWKAMAVLPPSAVLCMSIETEGRPERSIGDGKVTPNQPPPVAFTCRLKLPSVWKLALCETVPAPELRGTQPSVPASNDSRISAPVWLGFTVTNRSEEHTSELQ